MLGGNLQEWEEYDARLPDDSPVAEGTLATQRYGSKITAENECLSPILRSRFQFINYPPCAPVHQGTGDIVYSPWLVDPPSVPGGVAKPLDFVTPKCSVSVLCMTIDTPQGPNWYGIAYKQNIQFFNSVNIFCHPHPGHAGMKDTDYQSRDGEWRKLFRYAQNLGFQLSAANSNQILVVPFFSNASYSSGGIFTSNWKAILTVIVNGIDAARRLPAEFRSSVNLEVFEQRLREGKTLQHTVQNIVLSSFSFGRSLMGTLRGGMAGLHGILKEVWDFDGSGGPVPSSSPTVRALVYDQAVSNSPLGFHVPKPRWSKFPPAKNSDLHGFLPNMLMWHAATESRVGKAPPLPSDAGVQEFEMQMQTGALNSSKQQFGSEFLQTAVESQVSFEGPFLLSNVGEVSTEILNGSVGRGGLNHSDDIRLVQRLLNSHLPVPLVPLSEDGICGPRTIFAIETYQKNVLGMKPPDGRVDPGGPTFRSLMGGRVAPLQAVSPTSPAPSPGAWTPNVTGPSNMREAAWGYLLRFTKKHEGAVLHMYNNRTANSTTQDVTCGVGFRLDPRGAATQSWVKAMFFDPSTNQTPSDDQMLADWDAAANLARTSTNLALYASVCRMRMYPDRVYNQMALILRDQKLPALLKSFPDDFKDFSNFPAAAQVFCVSFAYGRIPFDYPKMRASIRDGRWADASKECYLRGGSVLKNQAHADLLILAQRVVDQNLDRDTLPPLANGEVPEYETQMELGSETLSGSDSHEGPVDAAEGTGWRMDSREFDPYAEIRPALRPEHAALDEGELTVIVGRQPTIVTLHRMLASPEPRLAALAVLLGKAGRRSIPLNGSNVPIPTYLRLLARLCREAAEHTESEAMPATVAESQVAPPAAATPQWRDIRQDAFFDDEWAPAPTPLPNPRNVHFNRFTTLTTTSATEQTVLTRKPNPLDPLVTSGLLQPEVIPASHPTLPGELYWIYVPDTYQKAVKDASAARKTAPTARVSVLFGVGVEVNRHGLRSFFASTADRILIEVGGIERVPEGTEKWGIGITDKIVADLLFEALGTKVPSQLEVLAAYSTGYRGLNGTINNALLDLTPLKKLIFYDCLFRGDAPKAPSGAAMPSKRHPGAPAHSPFNTWRAVQAVITASPSCNTIVYDVSPGGTPTYSDGKLRVEIPGATLISLKPFNVELKAIIFARLMDNGIKDGYFTAAQVPASISALIPLLPKRGTLSSSSSKSSVGTIGHWASQNSTKIARAMKDFDGAVKLARANRLMGWVPDASEFGHDGFLPEFGWEHLAG